ncbi:unnamed protein product [Closterium sp. Yama58-4]|nr:unnamed protein product [Closterium sp. Yama58-4]
MDPYGITPFEAPCYHPICSTIHSNQFPPQFPPHHPQHEHSRTRAGDASAEALLGLTSTIITNGSCYISHASLAIHIPNSPHHSVEEELAQQPLHGSQMHWRHKNKPRSWSAHGCSSSMAPWKQVQAVLPATPVAHGTPGRQPLSWYHLFTHELPKLEFGAFFSWFLFLLPLDKHLLCSYSFPPPPTHLPVSRPFFNHPAVALAPIQQYPLPHYLPSPLQPTSQSLRPIHPAISSPLPPRRRLSLLPAVASPSSPPSPLPPPRRRLSLLPAVASPSSPSSRLPPPRRRVSLLTAVASPSSPMSPLPPPAVASPSSPPSPLPPPRRRLSLLPAVASPSSPPSPLPPPRRRLSLLPAVASPHPRRRLSCLPAVSSPSSSQSPLPPPRRRLRRQVHERKRELVREGGSVRELGWVRECGLVSERGLVRQRGLIFGAL